jgi:hypothetical protein
MSLQRENLCYVTTTVPLMSQSLIATSYIEKGLALLYSDKDFDPFVENLGLQSAMSGT